MLKFVSAVIKCLPSDMEEQVMGYWFNYPLELQCVLRGLDVFVGQSPKPSEPTVEVKEHESFDALIVACLPPNMEEWKMVWWLNNLDALKRSLSNLKTPSPNPWPIIMSLKA